mmetsp:Transcript_83070/g.240401  ORF Transcript_83070/g.240401 Transcript_83070/m.240401 type:complete len:283 (+) Transcript_83070:73-921(+)
MGAAALAADVGGVCLPLAVGSAVGSACTSAHDRCGQRICVVDGVPRAVYTCAEVTNCSPQLTFTACGCLHDVSVPTGVVGTFTDNEPVLGVRARALPYVQAIGRRPRASDKSAASVRLSVAATGSTWGNVAGGGVATSERYVFGDLPFALPDVCLQDMVIFAFGTRTVVRLPFFSNAPLDFDIIGTVRLPLSQLLQASQPVEVLIPIQVPGDLGAHVVRISATFHTAGHDPKAAVVGAPVLPPQRGVVGHGAARCDSEDLDKEIDALEKQLQMLKGMSERRG